MISSFDEEKEVQIRAQNLKTIYFQLSIFLVSKEMIIKFQTIGTS